MPEVVFHVDQSKSMRDQETPGRTNATEGMSGCQRLCPGVS